MSTPRPLARWIDWWSRPLILPGGNQAGADLLVVLALALIGHVALVDALAVAGFALGQPVGGGTFVAGSALALALAAALGGRAGLPRGRIVAGLGAVVLGLAGAIGLASLVYDVSWDGQKYHLPAIIRLAAGWNPLHDPAPADAEAPVPLAHYPKATWLYAAALARLSGSLEAGKAVNLALAAGAALLLMAALAREAEPLTRCRALVGGLALANPVVGKQLQTHYVDGALASLLVAAAAALLLMRRRVDAATALALALSLLLLATVKQTGPIYAALLCLGLLAWRAWRRQPWRRAGAIAALALALGVGALGYHPYVQNALATGNPVHPFDGSGAAMDAQRPVNLGAASRLEKLAYGVFAESRYRQGAPAELKPPVWLTPGELRAMAAVDTRIGGFGPLFGLALLLALVTLAGLRRPAAEPLVIAAIFLGTAALFPEPWWARFVPQLWLVPVFVALAGRAARGARPLATWSRHLLIGVLLVNASASVAANAGLIAWRNLELRRGLAEMAAAEAPLAVAAFFRETTAARLAERGIRFRLVSAVDCPRPLRLPKARACPLGE